MSVERLAALLRRAEKLLLEVNDRINDDAVPFFGDDAHELLNEIAAVLRSVEASLEPPHDPFKLEIDVLLTAIRGGTTGEVRASADALMKYIERWRDGLRASPTPQEPTT